MQGHAETEPIVEEPVIYRSPAPRIPRLRCVPLVALALALAAAHAAMAGPRLVINEINANVTGGCDEVELRVTRCGTMGNVQLWQRRSLVLPFGSFFVQAGDMIVVHLNSGSVTCNPSSCGNEGGAANELFCAGNYPAAYDWYSGVSGLLATNNVLTLYDSTGTILDAVLLTNGTSPPDTASVQQAALVAAAGEWLGVSGVPPGGFVGADFVANAVPGVGTTGGTIAGTSIQRVGDVDTNRPSDWTITPTPSSWGGLNAGQSGGTGPCVLGVGGTSVATHTGRLLAVPNPARELVEFRLDQGPLGAGRLRVYDLLGRTVRDLPVVPGMRVVSWDTRDGLGRPAPPGRYVARLETSRAVASATVLVAR